MKFKLQQLSHCVTLGVNNVVTLFEAPFFQWLMKGYRKKFKEKITVNLIDHPPVGLFRANINKL